MNRAIEAHSVSPASTAQRGGQARLLDAALQRLEPVRVDAGEAEVRAGAKARARIVDAQAYAGLRQCIAGGGVVAHVDQCDRREHQYLGQRGEAAALDG